MIDGRFVNFVCWSILAHELDRLPHRDLRP